MLKGKTAIVTGGSRGIGEAIAYKPESMGADIAVIYAGNAAAAENVCNKCRQESGVKAIAYQCDVSDFSAAKDTVAKIKSDFGTVHILVNNAGITRDGLLAVMKEEDFDSVMDTNLKGAFNMIRHCSGLFIRNREGCIINITSVAGIMGNAGQCNYSASKAGLIGLTKSVARELAQRAIRCNAVAPGFIATDMTDNQKDNPLLKMIPLGAMGETEDVADAAAYLATVKYVTGEVLRVDGGMSENRRVVVTGIGAITPLGNNVADTWEGLKNGRNGIGPITLFDTEKFKAKPGAEVKDFNPNGYLEVNDVYRTDRYAQFAVAAAQQAVDESRVEGTVEPERFAVIFGTGIGGIGTFETEHTKLMEKGQTVCIIEAMKLMNEITAEDDGVISEICVTNGQIVEYGTELFRIRR